MLQRAQHLLVALLLIAVAMITVLLSVGCRNRPRPGEIESEDKLKGEPDRYSATIVRTIDDGARQETTITREARSGEQRREEWTEQSHNCALVWRPYVGKSY